VLASPACVTTPGSQPAIPVLRIGVDLPLSGRESRAAVPALNGIQFFVQTHPMLDGFQVQLSTKDDAHDGSPNPNVGVTNVRAFIGDSSVVAMLGPFNAMVARKEIPIANSAGLAMVTPATSNPCLTRDVYIPSRLNPARTEITCKDAGLPPASELRPDKTNNFFRLTTTDELQGAAAADYAFMKLHIQRAAVISDHEVYGQGLADAFSARLTNLGGSVLGQLDLEPTKTDATGFLTSMKDAGARAIYFGGTSKGGCGIRYQMRAIFPTGEGTPFLGGDGIAHDPMCVNLAADNSPGIFATVPFVDATARPGAAAILRSFKAAHGSSADYGPYTLVAYDATAILYAALDRAIRDAGGKRPERSNVTAALARTSNLAGATGNLGFDAQGDTTNRMVSIFEATGPDPRAPWRLVDGVDYSARLPY
jgi:branched-chain amino acid transport system substrate-binding protein